MKKSSTSRKITKKLFLSLMSVLFALSTLVTASYAWFSMNTSVAVNNLQIEVAAPQSLLVSNTSATTGFGASTTLSNDTTSRTPAASSKFAPVSYSGVCASWYALTNYAKAKVNEQGQVAGLTLPADGDTSGFDMTFDHDGDGANQNPTAEVSVFSASGDYFYDQVWLKLEGTADDANPNPAEVIKVTAEYVSTTNNDDIKKAMHIVFVVNNAVVGTIDMGSTGDALSIANLLTLEANAASGTEVKIYYFLSGNDSDCKNVNITADNTLNVKLTFEIATPNS